MSDLADVKAIYSRFRPWLVRYHGGMPTGFLAAIIKHESGGRMDSAGDPTLGEVGIFQITSTFPPSVGVAASARYDAETNVFLGCLEYQIEAVKMYLAAPLSVRLGTADSWKLARLAFAIGAGGTRALIRDSGGAHPGHAGNVFGALRTYVNRTGGQALGSQSAAKILARVNAVDVQWALGQQINPFYGPPEKIPSPAGVSYRLPADVAPYLSSSLKQLAILGLVAAGGVALVRVATR